MTAVVVLEPNTPSALPSGSRPRVISCRCRPRMADLEELALITLLSGAAVTSGVGVGVGLVSETEELYSHCRVF